MVATTKKPKIVEEEYMTFNQMKIRFPEAYILVANPHGPTHSIRIDGGKYLFHHKKKLTVIAKMAEHPNRHLTIIYTGNTNVPANSLIAL